MGIYIKHSICLKDDDNKIIVSTKQLDKLLINSNYYKKYEKYWFDQKYFSINNPIIEIDLDFTIDSVLQYFNIEKNEKTCYYFYHVFDFNNTF